MYSTKYISTNNLSQLDLLHKTLNLKEDTTKKNDIEDIKTKINNKINEIEEMITELQSSNPSSITFNNDNESIAIQQIPNTSKIGVYKDENIILRIDETGNIYCMNLCPNSIYFGNTDVGQTSKPSGSIVDIVTSDNKETLDNYSLNNKDSYVPSYRVLQENYALKTDIPVVPVSTTDVSVSTIPKTKIILNETNFNADNWTINVYTDRADKYFSRKTIILRNDSSTSSIYEIYISGIINFVDGKNRNLAGKSIRITFQTSESVYSESITYNKRRDTANGISSVLDPLSSEYDNYILCMFKNYVPEGIETIRINIEIPIGEDALFTDINNIGRYNLLITKIDNIETTGTEIISS